MSESSVVGRGSPHHEPAPDEELGFQLPPAAKIGGRKGTAHRRRRRVLALVAFLVGWLPKALTKRALD